MPLCEVSKGCLRYEARAVSSDSVVKKASSSPVLLAIVLACLLAAGFLQPAPPGQRAGHAAAAASLRNAPPLVVFTTVALGGLSGVVVDILWVRAEYLKELGDYVEIAQLSDWITKLEPRLPEVWDYHSLNLAYNISSMCADPADRRRWVYGGIRLLRDEALVFNPDNAVLYDRLCRIYMHKFIEQTDPAHDYYRVAWARAMTELLGGSSADYGEIAANLELQRRMKDEYKLDPQLMRKIDEQCGPLDWRLGASHVVYWASRGKAVSKDPADPGFDVIICEAMIDVFLNGRVADLQSDANVLQTGAYFNIVPKVQVAFESRIREHGLSFDGDSPLRNMYAYFLRRAILVSQENGRGEIALSLFDTLKDRLHDPECKMPFEEYYAKLKAAPDLQKQVEEIKTRMLREQYRDDD